MKNTVAVLPLAIALFGGAMIPDDTDPGLRVRLAATMAPRDALEVALTDEQLAWLDEHNPFGIPRTALPVSHTLVIRQGYTLAHNNVDLIADWVSFHLTKKYVKGNEKRPGTSAFKPDPALPAGRRAELADYRGWKGVYDRGHQCASADSKGRGTRVIRESFLLSNMTPQDSRLNQQEWRLLEDDIQRLAASRGEAWVVTGPAFVDDDADGLVEYEVIGDSEVAVPTHYFKIVVVPVSEGSDTLESMAFLIPNETPDEEMDQFLVSIDEIERVTGLDFLEEMDDSVEDALEAAVAHRILS